MKTYKLAFKELIVELLESGRAVREVSEEYGLSDGMIRRWRREYRERQGLDQPKVLSAEAEEINRLKKELREVKLERDILKKAVRIFSTPDR